MVQPKNALKFIFSILRAFLFLFSNILVKLMIHGKAQKSNHHPSHSALRSILLNSWRWPKVSIVLIKDVRRRFIADNVRVQGCSREVFFFYHQVKRVDADEQVIFACDHDHCNQKQLLGLLFVWMVSCEYNDEDEQNAGKYQPDEVQHSEVLDLLVVSL